MVCFKWVFPPKMRVLQNVKVITLTSLFSWMYAERQAFACAFSCLSLQCLLKFPERILSSKCWNWFGYFSSSSVCFSSVSWHTHSVTITASPIQDLPYLILLCCMSVAASQSRSWQFFTALKQMMAISYCPEACLDPFHFLPGFSLSLSFKWVECLARIVWSQ